MTSLLFRELILVIAGIVVISLSVAAIGGLGMEMLVALFLMPCMYVLTARNQSKI